MTQPFLPFAKPVIDEETIAAVADVLRSGWITSGPKVQAFEAALSAYFGGRLVRTAEPGPDGHLEIDFNRTVNLPCAFTGYATCPLPPTENRLAVAVAAGERSPA